MSKFGGGTGTPMRTVDDPNDPSFDPATRHDRTTKMIIELCDKAWDRMSSWEQRFCTEVYGLARRTRQQHVRVWKIHRKHSLETRVLPDRPRGENNRA